MGKEPLVIQEIDAAEELVRQFNKIMPVSAAFWLKKDEGRTWYLYIASDQIDDGNMEAYRDILRLADQMATPYLDPFHVKLIPASDPLAQDAMEIHRKYPSKIATRLNGQMFGGMWAEGVFLYPTAVTVSVP